MKFALPLILLLTLALDACTTLANRRDLYSPNVANGPNTQRLAQWHSDRIDSTNVQPQPHGAPYMRPMPYAH